MKRISLLFSAFLIVLMSLSCKKESNSDSYDYSYKNDYIRDKVMLEISKGTIGHQHLFVVNEKALTESEIDIKLSSIKKEDIISVEIINIKDGVNSKYPNAKEGVVKINYYIDYLLKPNYYNINNVFITSALNDLIAQKKVVQFPLIVLNGLPLRGTTIKEKLDGLNSESVTAISVLDYNAGLSIYGERAINGVVMIAIN
jgi:hypothetical protein